MNDVFLSRSLVKWMSWVKCQQFERYATGSLCLSAYGKMTNRSYLAQLANIFHIFTSKSTLVVFCFFFKKKNQCIVLQNTLDQYLYVGFDGKVLILQLCFQKLIWLDWNWSNSFRTLQTYYCLPVYCANRHPKSPYHSPNKIKQESLLYAIALDHFTLTLQGTEN